ncbi:MAG: DUF2127 domain-containing protein [Blastocatellia bacterium]
MADELCGASAAMGSMKMEAMSKIRPAGITALSIFFMFGATMSFITFVSLWFPGSFLEPMWRLNPRAREGFAHLGVAAIALMGVVCVACAAAAGLWRGARWGYWLAVVVLAINLLGDITNVVTGTEPRAAVGIPIVIAIFVFLSRRHAIFLSGRLVSEAYDCQTV